MTGESQPVASPPRGGYRALVNNFPNGVLVLFDTDLRYRIVGPSVLPFSNREASEMVGNTVNELFPEPTARRLEPKLNDTLEGNTCSFDIEYDGRVHHVETRPTTLDGDPYGVLVTQEVTENRQTTAELARQNQRLNEFADLVSHDLRNPLEVAFAGIELAREDANPERLDDVEFALRRMESIIEDVLTLARQGQPIDEREQVSVATCARESWRVIDTKEAELTVETDQQISADRDRLHQLFENLFRNAIEHGGNDVTVSVGPLDEAGFYVADDGPGIPDAERSRVFESGYSTSPDGTGFGLAIVKEIAEAHGWAIRVTEAADGGTRFEITDVEFIS